MLISCQISRTRGNVKQFWRHGKLANWQTKNSSPEMSPVLYNLNFLKNNKIYEKQTKNQKKYFQTNNLKKSCYGVIGSDVPWLECPACNALTWVITVTE